MQTIRIGVAAAIATVLVLAGCGSNVSAGKATVRLRLASPQQLAALAAFIEQIGPEPAPG